VKPEESGFFFVIWIIGKDVIVIWIIGKDAITKFLNFLS
jgi:hypothetical protein